MDVTWWLGLLAVLVALCVAFVYYMSANHGVFKEMGIETPPTSRLMGNLGQAIQMGVFKAQLEYYHQFKDKKVYGFYDTRTPILMVKDLDIVKEVMVKKFNHFVNRRSVFELDPPLSLSLLALKGDHWKHVRNAVSPTFSSGRIKKMSAHVERNANLLVEFLANKQERNEEFELKNIMSLFTLNTIASTGFGLDVNAFKDEKNEFVENANNISKIPPVLLVIALVCPKLANLLSKLGVDIVPSKAVDFFVQVVDRAMDNRKGESKSTGKAKDFLDLVIQSEEESEDSKKNLTREEIHAQAIIFIAAGFDTVSTVLSFTLFLLAVHPEICKKVQEEVDEKIGKDNPNYDNVQTLTYLDMCINESMRLFPPGFVVDRKCTEDVEIQGIKIPKDMVVMIPIYAIHHDPDIWQDAEKFHPERFSAENKDSHHPFAHLPFGQGPRNCIGMRLGQLEMKVAIASILQKFTPTSCNKTVYPVNLSKLVMKAEDGLWVKLELRK